MLMKFGSYATAYGNSVWAGMNDFYPLPEMKKAEWDLVIVMIWKNSVTYGVAVDDIFFAAHQSQNLMTAKGRNQTLYSSDSPSSGMGCTQQVGRISFCLACTINGYGSINSALPAMGSQTTVQILLVYQARLLQRSIQVLVTFNVLQSSC